MSRIEVLLPYISKWFLDKQEHFTTFAQADSRLEGWFKAELLVLFNRLVASQVIEKFEREANVSSPKDGKRKQVDFGISLRSTRLRVMREPLAHRTERYIA